MTESAFGVEETPHGWAIVKDGMVVGYFGRGEEGRLSAKSHLARMLDAPIPFCTEPEPGLTVCGTFLP